MMANQFGGSGNDTLTGTSSEDTILGNAGDDTLSGGAGNDSLYGGDGHDSIEGEAGDDIIVGNAGNDDISGGDGSDHLSGNEGEDSLSGGSGNDSIYGGDQSDTLSGGDGDDEISGGDGDDTIEGGKGDDVIYGDTGADVFVISDDSGQDIIKDFRPHEGDNVRIEYPGINSYDDLLPLMSSDGNFGTVISFPDGSTTQLEYYDFNNGSADDFSFEAGPVCFLRGTLIETLQGALPVEEVRTGTMVRTQDEGWQPVLLVQCSRYRFGAGPNRMKPIRIKAGALGDGCPARDLLVSPQHRIGLPAAAPDVLVPAVKLVALRGVSARSGCRSARYYHLLLAEHALIRAEGTWAESMLVRQAARRKGFLPPEYLGASNALVRPEARRLAVKDLEALVRGVEPTDRLPPPLDGVSGARGAVAV